MQERKIEIKGIDPRVLFGYNDNHLIFIEKQFDARVAFRGDTITLYGEEDELEKLENIFSELIFLVNKNEKLDIEDVRTIVNLVHAGQGKVSRRKELNTVILFTNKNYIKARTSGQVKYHQAVQKNDIVFAIGPAGTGKTFLAVAMAVSLLKERQVKKIVLARPAVEAGESLGFLPGDFKEKVDPYLVPLYDALRDMIAPDKLKRYLEQNVIEVIPLAYMRGRTLDDAFVILDEAQNTSPLQMKMFLTRLGVNSKAIITGDITQIDLPEKIFSGLVQIQDILKGIEGVEFVYLKRDDVVRHRLVKDIIEAYQQFDERNGETS